MKFGSLFAGIGGMDLGLERAGMKCVWQVEKDEYARRVLEKNWPNNRRWDDVRTFPPAGQWDCDLIAGGFPCQDISNAGKRAGIEGEQSGLWREFHRIICVLRPRLVLVENVAAILSDGLGRVLGDLAKSGYDTEWDCIPAEAVGAPHERDRAFLVANAQGEHGSRRRLAGSAKSDAPEPGTVQSEVANVDSSGSQVRACFGGNAQAELAATKRANSTGDGHWAAEPGVVRMVHGVPYRVDRIRGLGNAVVPQVAEWIGRRLMEQSI
jgi:DNA (cytosine-5)-methyltransferase 1